MRKNTKMLIIGLSVISVVSTAAAITVPLLMHFNQDDKNGASKDSTIKKVVVKEGGLIDEILTLATEENMITKVEEFNKSNNWDSVFTFTNENEKIVTSVVKEVIFNLDTKPTIDQGVFTIIYKDEIKAASGANVIRVNRSDIALDVSIIDPAKLTAATNLLANLLTAASDFAAQESLYNSWATTPPQGLETIIEDIVIFNQGQIDWSTAVSGFEISVGTINAGQKIPGVNIQIILNSGYTADKSKLLVKIDDLG
ncbi:MAG: hypothetical protein ACRDCD_02580, partial [Mycoplasmoidaceae bacterium]